MLKLLVCMCFTFGISASFAMTKADEKQAVLEEIFLNISVNEFYTAAFKQVKTLKGLSFSIESSGTISYLPKMGLYWETNKPLFSANTFMENSVITWLSDNEHQSTEKLSIIQKNISEIFQSILSANLSAISSRFIVSVEFYADSHWRLLLTPNATFIKQSIKSVTLEGVGHISEVIIKSANGDTTKISLTPSQNQEHFKKEVCKRFISKETECHHALITDSPREN